MTVIFIKNLCTSLGGSKVSFINPTVLQMDGDYFHSTGVDGGGFSIKQHLCVTLGNTCMLILNALNKHANSQILRAHYSIPKKTRQKTQVLPRSKT